MILYANNMSFLCLFLVKYYKVNQIFIQYVELVEVMGAVVFQNDVRLSEMKLNRTR